MPQLAHKWVLVILGRNHCFLDTAITRPTLQVKCGTCFVISARSPGSAKWLLTVGMLLGRLEILTVLVLVTRAFWRH
mgnify:CR=1 FL=1